MVVPFNFYEFHLYTESTTNLTLTQVFWNIESVLKLSFSISL